MKAGIGMSGPIDFEAFVKTEGVDLQICIVNIANEVLGRAFAYSGPAFFISDAHPLCAAKYFLSLIVRNGAGFANSFAKSTPFV